MKVSDVIKDYCLTNQLLTLDDVISSFIPSLKSDDEREQREARIEYILLGGDELEGCGNQIKTLMNEFSDYEEEVFEYIKYRIVDSKHPILLARYNDILWEYTKAIYNKHPEVQYAFSAIDNYIDIVLNKLEKTAIYTTYKLIRAFNLSILINNKERIYGVKQLLFESLNTPNDDKPGIWSNVFKCLLKNRNYFDKEESKLFESNMFERLNRFEKDTDFYHTEHAVLCLLEYYAFLKDKAKTLEILQIYKRIFINFSGKLSGIQKAYWLQEIRALMIKYQLNSEADEISIMIQGLGREIKKDLDHVYEVEIKPDKKVLDKHLKLLQNKSTEYQMAFMAHTYIKAKKDAENAIKELSKDNPFFSIVKRNLLNPDYIVAAQVTLEDDGALIQQTVDMLKMDAPYLHYVLSFFKSEGNLKQDQVYEVIKKSPVILDSRYSLLEKALDAYYHERNEEFIHLIIPQIEAAFRELVMQLGGVIITPNKIGGDNYKLLHDILLDPILKIVFDEDTLFNLRIILVENRGWNIRNNVCHGILSDIHFSSVVSERLLQIVFLLGLIRREKIN